MKRCFEVVLLLVYPIDYYRFCITGSIYELHIVRSKVCLVEGNYVVSIAVVNAVGLLFYSTCVTYLRLLVLFCISLCDYKLTLILRFFYAYRWLREHHANYLQTHSSRCYYWHHKDVVAMKSTNLIYRLPCTLIGLHYAMHTHAHSCVHLGSNNGLQSSCVTLTREQLTYNRVCWGVVNRLHGYWLSLLWLSTIEHLVMFVFILRVMWIECYRDWFA